MQKADLSWLLYVSRKHTSNLDTLRLHKGWILLSRSGTIGNLAYVRSDMDGLIGSDDIIRIIADPQKILSGYLFAVLSSTLLVSLIQQKTYGAVIPHIEAHHMFNLPIPRLDPKQEKHIHNLIEKAAALRVEASKLIENSQERLLEAADLPIFSREEILNKGCWKFSYRGEDLGKHALTSWTYSPISKRMISILKSKKNTALGNLLIDNGIFYGARYKRVESDPGRGVELLNQANIFQLRPQGRWISNTSFKDLHNEMVPNHTILAAAQGTMGDNEVYGHCEFSYKNFNNKVISGHNVRIIPDIEKINPGYLYAFLSSDYGFHLLRNTSYGTKLLGFILDLVANIPIPILDKDSENSIGAQIYQAYDNRAEAILLEDEAQKILTNSLDFIAPS